MVDTTTKLLGLRKQNNPQLRMLNIRLVLFNRLFTHILTGQDQGHVLDSRNTTTVQLGVNTMFYKHFQIRKRMANRRTLLSMNSAAINVTFIKKLNMYA